MESSFRDARQKGTQREGLKYNSPRYLDARHDPIM